MLLDKLLTNLAIDVQPFALCEVDSGWRLRLPGPPSVMVHFVLHGDGVLRGPRSQEYCLRSSWMAIVPAGTRHALETTDRVFDEVRIDGQPEVGPVHHLTAGSSGTPNLVVACGLLFARFGMSLGLFDHLREIVAIDMSDTQQVAAAFEGILAEQSRPDVGSQMLTAAMMSQCLVYFFRHLSARPEKPIPWLAALNDARLGRVVDLILDKPAAGHTVDSLADVAGMSRSAFAQHFASSFGYPPMTFVHAIRMQKAADLLRVGSLPIDTICRHVGFASRSHFSRAFKKHVGVPPNEYRAKDPFFGAARLSLSRAEN